MTLLTLKQYLKVNHRARLEDIASALNLNHAVTESLLAHWIRKERVIKHEIQSCSTLCKRCVGLEYEWIEGVSDDKL